MREAPCNSDDVIDSRDIIERIEELRGERVERTEASLPFGECQADELATLEALAKKGENSADDWPYGATLIRDSYFKSYAMELAVDIGAINSDADWPHNCIDWEQAARELRRDYTSVEFAGVTYWVR